MVRVTRSQRADVTEDPRRVAQTSPVGRRPPRPSSGQVLTAVPYAPRPSGPARIAADAPGRTCRVIDPADGAGRLVAVPLGALARFRGGTPPPSHGRACASP